MFSFFEKLPEEISLAIVNNLTLSDQIILSRVNKSFNILTKDQSLELTKFNQAALKHYIGDACVILYKRRKNMVSVSPYRLFLTKDGKEVHNTGMEIYQKNYNKYKEALKGDSQSLISKLKSCGETTNKIAKVLEEELKIIEESKIFNRSNLPSLKLFSAKAIASHNLNHDTLPEDCKHYLINYVSNGLHKRFIGIGK